MPIRILPGNIANMIAAGEVVQRPASVVKELVENAVDAGSSNVTVVIQDAGRTLIQVIDDGCGMNPDEAVLCFEEFFSCLFCVCSGFWCSAEVFWYWVVFWRFCNQECCYGTFRGRALRHYAG